MLSAHVIASLVLSDGFIERLSEAEEQRGAWVGFEYRAHYGRDGVGQQVPSDWNGHKRVDRRHPIPAILWEQAPELQVGVAEAVVLRKGDGELRVDRHRDHVILFAILYDALEG